MARMAAFFNSKQVRKTINVSENDNVTSHAQQHSHRKQHLKRCVLRRLWKTGSDCVDVDVTWQQHLANVAENNAFI